jgi:hypothetical protein
LTQTRTLTSRSYSLKSAWAAIEFCFEQGWTDGLPVVPPTERAIWAFLDYVQLEPTQVVGEIPERDRSITAEKLAANAVMAGCKPEYMPVLIAAVEALTDPLFKFNHLASLGSPWPIMIVSGPVVKELGINYGTWVMGPGCRANATIGRTLSLLVGNCALGHIGGIQRGTYGHPGRFNSLCIGENPDLVSLGWEPHNVEMGFDRDTSVVTLLSTDPWIEMPTAVEMRPERILAVLAGSIAEGEFVRGVYPVIMSRPYAAAFVRAAWTKEAMREWMYANTKRSVASLKARGRWGSLISSEPVPPGELSKEILPSDETTYVYLWKAGEVDQYLFHVSATHERKSGIYFIIAGADEADAVAWLSPYPVSSNPVTKTVRPRGS